MSYRQRCCPSMKGAVLYEFYMGHARHHAFILCICDNYVPVSLVYMQSLTKTEANNRCKQRSQIAQLTHILHSCY